MTVYKGCPYCDAVFRTGPDDDWPLRAHLIEAHGDAAGRIGPRSRPADSRGAAPPSDWPVEALCRRFLASEDADEIRRLAFAVLHGRGVDDTTVADWFGLDPGTVRRLREGVAAPADEREGSRGRERGRS